MSKADRRMQRMGKDPKKPRKFESTYGPKTSRDARISLNGKQQR